MSRADEVLGLLRGLRDQFVVLDDMVRGFRDRQGLERRREWELHRQVELAAVSAARRRRVRHGIEAAVLALFGILLIVGGSAWLWLAIPLFVLAGFRASQIGRTAIPAEPDYADPGPVVLPDAPRGSRTGELLRRAAAARDAVDGMLPLIDTATSGTGLVPRGGVPGGGIAGSARGDVPRSDVPGGPVSAGHLDGLVAVIADTRTAAERAIADLGRALLGMEHLTRQPGVSASALSSRDQLSHELEQAVSALETLAASVASQVTESGATTARAEFEARLAGVQAVLRTLRPATTWP